MSEVKVTRAHRAAATTALMMGVSDAVFAFEFAGETCDEESLEEAARVARAIAETEHRVRAAVIEQLDQLVINSHLMHGDHGPDYVFADSIRNLIDDLKAKQ